MPFDFDKDIRFDRYGDISFFSNDIELVTGETDVLYQNVLDRLISNNGDLELNEDYGANLSSLIGQTDKSKIESWIQGYVKTSLTRDSFLSPEQINIITFMEQDKVFLRVRIYDAALSGQMEQSFVINSIFNTSSGILYVTD